MRNISIMIDPSFAAYNNTIIKDHGLYYDKQASECAEPWDKVPFRAREWSGVFNSWSLCKDRTLRELQAIMQHVKKVNGSDVINAECWISGASRSGRFSYGFKLVTDDDVVYGIERKSGTTLFCLKKEG